MKEDGGSAFPWFAENWNEDSNGHPGMTMRDHFAGQALAGLASYYARNNNWEGLARAVYDIADVMLEEREK